MKASNRKEADQNKISRLEAENRKLRQALHQIAYDCFKVLDDEICCEAEHRTWRALGNYAKNAAYQ